MKRYIPFIVAAVVILVTLVSSIIIFSIPREEEETIAQIKEGIVERNIVNTESGDTIVVEIEEVEGATEEELEPIDEEKIKEAAEKNISTEMYYYIEVNCTAQVVTVYKKDENNNYTIPVRSMICSTGRSTPSSGIYKMPGRRSRWRDLYGGVSGQYVTNIVGAILFHSVPYTCRAAEQDNSSLEYWEYDKLGTDASMGCVRLTVRDAKWIYENCGAGTQVEFYNDSNPGPLGRPSAKKISSYPDELRNWDPTDPDEDNPWHTYNENQPTNQQVDTKPVENKPANTTTQTTTPANTNTTTDTQSNNKPENKTKEETTTTNTNTTENTNTNNNSSNNSNSGNKEEDKPSEKPATNETKPTGNAI